MQFQQYIADNLEVEDFIDGCYKQQVYLKAYTHVLYPINGHELWPRTCHTPLQPAAFKKQSGGPKKLRKRELDEVQNSIKIRKFNIMMICTNCGNEVTTRGHV